MRWSQVLRISCTSMSSGPSQAGPRIFAPGSASNPTQASQFEEGALDASDLDASPFAQFHAWFKTARELPVPQCESCTLSTASLPSGRVSARFVYLKELDDRGFVIYSNFDTSKKAQDLKTNPHAALTFWWRELEQQVRVEGKVERLSNEESQRYYDTRIRNSRIGAWASRQSRALANREELEAQVKDVENRFEGEEKIPVPDFWGGLRIIPETLEFWQGRPSRLHDRFQYLRNSDGSSWTIERLSP